MDISTVWPKFVIHRWLYPRARQLVLAVCGPKFTMFQENVGDPSQLKTSISVCP